MYMGQCRVCCYCILGTLSQCCVCGQRSEEGGDEPGLLGVSELLGHFSPVRRTTHLGVG